ncbi:R2-like ligand-binding oxidase [Peribacillus frigoritolerans]|uniref:R2-like ligand-binding oxidase n=1 Tax=Peribacillus frigoritolerans TaxID=450367 RepID=UPI002570A3D6|nr:R2-like ligand-binding oxidase [Peribacillus frigoritolerans]
MKNNSNQEGTMNKREIITTSSRGINEELLPYRLFQKAKRFGIWNPSDIDFTQDTKDWKSLSDAQRNEVLRLISQFQAGEEAVTLDLLPLMMAIAKEGRLEEEMYLTTFLFEEAKHTEFFRLALNAIGETGDLSIYHTDTYKTIFYELLPQTMDRLIHDQSPEAIAEASTVYNMFVEGVLAETGYFSFYRSLEEAGIMPGLLKGVGLLKKDESRHIGYGTFLLQRLISEHEHIFDLVSEKMKQLTPYAIILNQEGMSGEQNAFGHTLDETMAFTMRQLSVRMDILARARGKRVEEIYRMTEYEVGVV